MQEIMTLAGNTTTKVESGCFSTTNREQRMESMKPIILTTGKELKTATTDTITETLTQGIIVPNTHRGQGTAHTMNTDTKTDGDTIKKGKIGAQSPANGSGHPTQNPTVLTAHLIL
jgi:hypothetical protein